MSGNDGSKRSKLLVICDLQTVALNSLPKTHREALVDFVRMVLAVARASDAHCRCSVVWSGLAFSDQYTEISESHKVFGALKRMQRLTKGNSRFFLKGEESTNFVVPPDPNDDSILWRSSLLPPSQEEWMRVASQDNVLNVTDDDVPEATVVGIRTSQAVLSTAQSFCDLGWRVALIEECIMDDNVDRHTTTLDHLLPIYGDVVNMAEWMERNCPKETIEAAIQEMTMDPNVRYLCDCGRGGHSFLYQQHLLMFHEGWARYPLQLWYADPFGGKSYTCPLGKKTVDFCDEPQFSKCCMYIKGREWLDEKDKIWELVPDIMPKTYVIDTNTFTGELNMADESAAGPFFLKECMKNGGKAVQVLSTLNDALEAAKQGNSKFVIQEHIHSPWLAASGQKCHIKSYFLLTEAAGTWELRMYPEAFLSVSPNPWSTMDLSMETQVTVKRTKRIHKEKECELWPGWPSSYNTVRELVSHAVKQAVIKGKLRSRDAAVQQFEIFSADVMMDTDGRGWLIECNFGCVMFDPLIGQPLTTIGLKTYQKLYESQGDSCEVNDHNMLADTVKLVFKNDKTTRWEAIGKFNASDQVNQN